MALFDTPAPADALEDLFVRERAAILAGRFDVLERLAHEKERLVASVLRRPSDGRQLQRLKAAAGRSQSLLQALDRGVRAAEKRLRGLAAGPATLQTYDASGRRQSHADPVHALQHRA